MYRGIIAGGYILQELSRSDMILRAHYFNTEGSAHNFTGFIPGDLIQYCAATRTVVASRDNFLYQSSLFDQDIFDKFLASMKSAEVTLES